MKPCPNPTGFPVAALLAAFLLPSVAGAASEYFIPLGDADGVARVSASDWQVTGGAGAVVNSHGSALTPDGRFLVAGSIAARPVGAVPQRPAGMSADDHAAHHGGGQAAAQGKMTGTLYLVDTETLEVRRQFDVPGPVHHVLVTGDGRFAVSTHPGEGGISVLSLDSGQVVASVPTGPAPNYVLAGPEGRLLYVSNSGNGTVSEIDTAHWYVVRNFRTGGAPEHLAWDKRRARLYVNDAAGGRVVALDTESGKSVTEFPVGASPHGIGLAPDGGRLFATSQGDEQLVVVDLATGKVNKSGLAPAPYHLAVDPGSGRLLITSRAEPVLWVVDPDRLADPRRVQLPGIGHQIAVRPEPGG